MDRILIIKHFLSVDGNFPNNESLPLLIYKHALTLEQSESQNATAVERLFRKIFEVSHVETVNRIEGIQFHTAEERYKALVEEAPDIIKRAPLKYIASYLGITQVSLSRIRGHR